MCTTTRAWLKRDASYRQRYVLLVAIARVAVLATASMSSLLKPDQNGGAHSAVWSENAEA